MKLQRGEEIPLELLRLFAYPGDHDNQDILLPIDLSVVDGDFPPDEEDIIDIHSQLDIDRMIEKLGMKGTAEALVKAQQAFLDNRTGEPANERPQPMTVQQWREIWADGMMEEGEEEELLEEDAEVEEGEEETEEGAEEPAAKKAKVE
eukprot:gb/GFBE01016812.1/.p1 GENE.gb/GFBE01016812.1/~~gb/GFBE01016812.1/.p1  ORF type:complete len:148 (+),score=45.56 gb/GFBE01016812.1/:1-444(+)